MAGPKFSFLRNEGSLAGGGKFWQSLCAEWQKHPDYDPKNYSVIFFNISGPIRCFIANWVRGKKILVRVDGIYHEKISPGAIDSIQNPLVRAVMGALYRAFGEREWLSELFNLFPRNAGILLKIWMSSGVIFQSEFSRGMYARYFPRKRSTVIVNAYPWSISEDEFNQRLNSPPPSGNVRVMTTYDFWRPSKRLGELIDFIVFCNEVKNFKVHLTILGYRDDRHPKNLSEAGRAEIKAGRYITTAPTFEKIDGTLRELILWQHFYATFTFRDNCPNAVIEAMAHGLPVLAQKTGGLADIVGTAGTLLKPQSAVNDHFSSFDHSFDYPAVDFEEAYRALNELIRNYPAFVQRAQVRFRSDLDLEHAVARYLAVRDLL